MVSYNVDCLREDEIKFELLVRNVTITSESKVHVTECRKWLRKLIREKAEVDVSKLEGKIIFVDEIDLCLKRHVELKSLLEGLKEESPNLHKVRLQSRLNHLLLRISCLLQYDIGGKAKEKLREIKEEIESVEKPTVDALVEGVGTEVIQVELRRLSDNNEEEENRLDSASGGDVFPPQSPSKATETETGTGTYKPDPSNVLQSGAYSLLALESLGHKDTLNRNNTITHHVNSLNTYTTPNVRTNESIFAKLRNPVESYLKDLRVSDGLEINGLLNFLRVMLKLKRETELNDQEIFEILSTYASGPLLSRIRSNKIVGPNVKHLHRDLITYFIPQGMREGLIREKVNRVQRFQEPLLGYVTSVLDSAEILGCDYSEKMLVDILILGLHPTVRARLVFHAIPNSINQLYELCIYEQNVRYSDSQRGGFSASLNRGLPNRHTTHRPVNFVNNVNSSNVPNDQGNEVRCYRCNKIGHYARNCRDNSGRFQRGVSNAHRGSPRGRTDRDNQTKNLEHRGHPSPRE